MNRFSLIAVCGVAAWACKTTQAPAPVETVQTVAETPQPKKEAPATPVNILGNSDFSNGVSAPWMPVILDPAKAEAEVKEGAYCVLITDRGVNNWDIQLSHRGLVIEEGHRYTVHAAIWATADTAARAKVGMAGPPYTEYWTQELAIGTTPKYFDGSFVKTRNTDSGAEFAIHLGGSLARSQNLPLSVCIDDVSMADPKYIKPKADVVLPKSDIRTNQVGYLPGFRKTATYRTDDKSPLQWTLKQNGNTVATGTTMVFGEDKASRENVHTIDFTDVKAEGEGYTLAVGDQESRPFAISKDVYKQMKIDALRYFYHNRSSMPIAMPYAAQEQWTRPAGHVSDSTVPCLPGSGCDYTLDVKGGWYDAGDHGKYVVNAGYSVWAMLNQYERALAFNKSAEAFGDKTLNIPESGNGVSDLLDEARYEIEFMLKMEVPAGNPLAGMVHHKIHDEDWTGIPTAPDKDPMKRFLHAPTTAATLNLSAVAAQASRIWKDIDSVFAKKCLEAGERTYLAAKKNPKMFAGPEDHKGGGAYEDNRVEDEFYWAASELYISTGDKQYLKELKKSPNFATIPTIDDVEKIGVQRAAMSWQSTEALGTISLLTAPNQLGVKDRDKLLKKIKAAADLDVNVISKEGYRVALTALPEPDYYWGSNFVVMNNLMILALAYDLTKNDSYLTQAVEGMDYLLGRNTMDQSYVTGFGTRPLKNPHHRFFAAQANPSFPPPPPGFMSGGPNQHLQDPRVLASVPKNCAPASCFVDHVDAYSVNEVAINWNAAFAWLAAYMDEAAHR
jgi:endoglucanase